MPDGRAEIPTPSDEEKEQGDDEHESKRHTASLALLDKSGLSARILGPALGTVQYRTLPPAMQVRSLPFTH